MVPLRGRQQRIHERHAGQHSEVDIIIYQCPGVLHTCYVKTVILFKVVVCCIHVTC